MGVLVSGWGCGWDMYVCVCMWGRECVCVVHVGVCVCVCAREGVCVFV